MNCAFVTGSVSRNAAGIFDAMRHLALSMSARGTSLIVLGVEDAHTESDIAAWQPISVKTFPMLGPQRFGYGLGLSRALSSNLVDLVHSHSLWNYTSVVTTRWHKQTGKQYVVHPHGMLDSWA